MSPSLDQYRVVLEHTTRQEEELRALLAEAERVGAEQVAQRAELGGRWGEARQELLEAVLPSITHDAIVRAWQLVGYAALRDPGALLQGVAAERASLQQRLDAIAADERFARRELLRDPAVGTLTRKLAELEEYAAGFRDVVERCQHPRLERLLEVGYGTPSYAVRWWRASYYGDWEAGDLILEKFPEKKEFSEVVAEYRQAQQVLEVYEPEIADLRRQIAEGEALEREHAELTGRLATVAQRHLADLRERTGRFVDDVGPKWLASRLAADPGVEALAVRLEGLARQKEYLAEIAKKQEAELAGLREELTRARRNVAKWSKPKAIYKPIDAELLAKVQRSPAQRHRKRLQRTWQTHSAVYGFSDHHHGRLAEDFLWWDLMTDGRLDGDFIPEVEHFREQHPGYRYERRSDEDEAAAAVADAQAEDVSAELLRDVS